MSQPGAGGGDERPNEEGLPISWPLVERRSTQQLTEVPDDRRKVPPAATRSSTGTLDTVPLTPFRIAAFVGAVIRAVDMFSLSDLSMLTSTVIVAAYTAHSVWRPVPYDNSARARLRTGFELCLMIAVVVVSGAWSSPFALCLVPTAMLASFVGGAGFSTKLVAGAAAIITVRHVISVGERHGIADAALWIVLLVLVSVTSGLSRRTAQQSADQRRAALDHVGRLAEANALLFSLQRVAQTLPASLDLNDVLDSTVNRVQSLIDHSMLTILLQTDTPGRLDPVRTTGYVTSGTVDERDLPEAMLQALQAPKTVHVETVPLTARGFAPATKSALYAALRARGSIVGLIALESLEPHHFGQQQAEILHGLAEPFGIAIDNARLFQQLKIVSADEERNRIARDLHDHIGSSLAYLGFEIDRTIAAARREEPVDNDLKELRTQVTRMVGEVRETLYDLRSNVSDKQDLCATLKQFVERVRDRSGVEIVFSSDQQTRLVIAHERELWHIAREALINVERHAQATHASVEWVSTPTNATLTIRDNGVGMLVGSGRVDSYGVRGMRERAAAIGAQMTMDSSTRGTVVHVSLETNKATSWG